jgi:3-hydroxybutyryl-CoA dehydrogenase
VAQVPILTTVLVIGAGTMGRGIAQVAAAAGLTTILHDAAPGQVDRALELVARDLQKGVTLGKLTAAEREDILGRLRPAGSLSEAVPLAEVVIEAIVEDMAAKTALFAELDSLAPPEALLATNTSALSITEIAAATDRPGTVLGLHFFNPAPRMALVEVVRGLETTDDTVNRALELVVALGKRGVTVNEFPGFAVSRINAMIGNEAFYMLMEGVASARDIDTALTLGLNHPMGPFELGDMVGWDIRLKVLEHLHATLGEKFRPCPLLRKYVAAGRLGRKVGRGVYDYRDEDRRGRKDAS